MADFDTMVEVLKCISIAIRSGTVTTTPKIFLSLFLDFKVKATFSFSPKNQTLISKQKRNHG